MQSRTKNEWRVAAFGFQTNLNSSHTSKRKRNKSISRRKNTTLQTPLNEVTNNCEIKNLNDQILASPILSKSHRSNDETSPIIVKDKKRLIKIKKAQFSAKNKLKCARKLTELLNNDTNERFIPEASNQTQDLDICQMFQIKEKHSENIQKRLDTYSKIITSNPSSQNNTPSKYIENRSPNHIYTQLTYTDWSQSPSKDIEIHTLHSSPILCPEEFINISPPRSPTIYPSQLDKIDFTDSPKKLSQEKEPFKIDICSSQDSSVVTISTNSTVADSLEEKNDENIEYISKKQRKKYKPGSYAYNLQKLLFKQKNDISLWKHELYLASTTNFQLAHSENRSIICLNIIKSWNTFGAVLLECVEPPLYEKCFLIPDVNFTQDLNLENGDRIEIYPSYFVKYLEVFDNIAKTFVNVSKIVKII